MFAKTLIFVRHGKAGHNLGLEREHRFAGSTINSELTVEGKKNALELTTRIKKYGECKQIFASSLKRSIETAKIISKVIDCPIQILKELDEIDIGQFAGHTEEEAKKLFPKEAGAFYSGEINNWSFPDGENFSQAAERAQSALLKIRNSMNGGETVLISGHGMINRLMFYLLKPEQTELWRPRSYPHDRIEVINLKNDE